MNKLETEISPFTLPKYSYGLLICNSNQISDIELKLIKYSKKYYDILLLAIDNSTIIDKEYWISKIPNEYLKGLELILLNINTEKKENIKDVLMKNIKKYKKETILYLELALKNNLDLDLPSFFYIEETIG
jgi:hypothetical protein